MKIALLSESPADEAAIAVLVQSVLGHPFKRVRPSLRARGWPNVAQVMPSIIRHLHFRTDADALVVVVDADDSVVHDDSHEGPGRYHPKCRLCQLRGIFHRTTKNLPISEHRRKLLRGVGVAVPALEGWYLCGRDAEVSEAAWVQSPGPHARPYTRRELKRRVYGTERPSLSWETQVAVQAVTSLAADTRGLEFDFPGFAALADDLRTWKVPKIPATSRSMSRTPRQRNDQLG